jgi:hypothetical protein
MLAFLNSAILEMEVAQSFPLSVMTTTLAPPTSATMGSALSCMFHAINLTLVTPNHAEHLMECALQIP